MLRDDQLKSMLGVAVLPAVFALALLTSGCNTMEGMGKDVQAAGGAMSNTAEGTKQKIEGTMDEDDEEMDTTEDKMQDEGTVGDQTQ